MIPILLTALLLAQNDPRIVTEAADDEVPVAALDAVRAEADPDVVTRGRSTTIVVKGRDVESLKTLKVNPPDGVRLGEIKPVPPAADGSRAVSVAVTVAADAKPGERELTLTVSPTVVGTDARPGDDATAKAMKEMMQAIVKRETKPEPAGTLHINAHDIKITKVEVAGAVVRVTVEDKEGDLAAGMPESAKGGDLAADAPDGIEEAEEKDDLAIVQIMDPILSEVRCGKEIFYDAVTEPKISERRAPVVVVQADLDTEALAGKTGCELRVRARDKAENVSAWYATKLPPR